MRVIKINKNQRKQIKQIKPKKNPKKTNEKAMISENTEQKPLDKTKKQNEPSQNLEIT